ncbi:hypothetical protein RCL1_007871 [Eukaryota sp. TZLM3-RCL]
MQISCVLLSLRASVRFSFFKVYPPMTNALIRSFFANSDTSYNDSLLLYKRLNTLHLQLSYQTIYYLHILSALRNIPLIRLSITIIGYGSCGQRLSELLTGLGMSHITVIRPTLTELPSNLPKLSFHTLPMTSSNTNDAVIWCCPSDSIKYIFPQLSFSSTPLHLVHTSSLPSKKLAQLLPNSLKISTMVPLHSDFDLFNAVPNTLDLTLLYSTFQSILGSLVLTPEQFAVKFVFGHDRVSSKANEYKDANKKHIHRILKVYYNKLTGIVEE